MCSRDVATGGCGCVMGRAVAEASNGVAGISDSVASGQAPSLSFSDRSGRMVPRALRGAPSCGTFSGSGFTSKCDAQQGTATFTAGASGCGAFSARHKTALNGGFFGAAQDGIKRHDDGKVLHNAAESGTQRQKWHITRAQVHCLRQYITSAGSGT